MGANQRARSERSTRRTGEITVTVSARLPDRQGIGILCILVGMLAISIQDALIKGFSGSYPLHEIVLIRSLVALPFMFVILQF